MQIALKQRAWQQQQKGDLFFFYYTYFSAAAFSTRTVMRVQNIAVPVAARNSVVDDRQLHIISFDPINHQRPAAHERIVCKARLVIVRHGACALLLCAISRHVHRAVVAGADLAEEELAGEHVHVLRDHAESPGVVRAVGGVVFRSMAFRPIHDSR